jgi:uncharacterized membrane protein
VKIFFPPFVAFVVFGFIVVLNSFFFPMNISDMGKGDLHAFMACFYYCWPLYFITALLTEGLIVTSVWDTVSEWSTWKKDMAVIVLGFICFIFAFGIAYVIWDRQTGYLNLAGLTFIMLMVQLAYWIINSFIMILFKSGKIKLPHIPKQADK